MSENNQMMSLEGQLVGLPLAGPESFSQQQLDYLKRALGVDETVLFDGNGEGTNSGTLSEDYTHFERLRLEIGSKDQSTSYGGQNGCSYFEIPTRYNMSWLLYGFGGGGSTAYYAAAKIIFSSSTEWSVSYGSSISHSETSTSVGGNTSYNANVKSCVFKIVGVHRIAGGN